MGRFGRNGVTIGLALMLLLAAGCADDGGEPAAPPDAAEEVGPGTHPLALEWNGRTREYIVDAPSGYDASQPTPLVIVLHGSPGSAWGVRANSSMDEYAERYGALVAYPQGVEGTFHPEPAEDDVDDLGFLRALVEHLVEVWNAAPDQVYATGFSFGASMSLRLAAEASDLFAAVAPMSGAYFGPTELIGRTAPVSVMTFAGLADRVWLPRIEAGLDLWHEALACEPGEPTTVDDEGRVSRTEASCADGSEVVVYRLAELAHAWPPSIGYDIDPHAIMWEFFTEHSRVDTGGDP